MKTEDFSNQYLVNCVLNARDFRGKEHKAFRDACEEEGRAPSPELWDEVITEVDKEWERCRKQALQGGDSNTNPPCPNCKSTEFTYLMYRHSTGDAATWRCDRCCLAFTPDEDPWDWVLEFTFRKIDKWLLSISGTAARATTSQTPARRAPS